MSDLEKLAGACSNRFGDWPTTELAAQCRMQARDNLDPEYSQFMTAVADRLSASAEVIQAIEVKRREWFCSGSDCSNFDHGRDEGFEMALNILRTLTPSPRREGLEP